MFAGDLTGLHCYVQVLDIAKKHGLESVDQQVGQLLGRAADIHLGSLIDRIYTMTRQRTDAERNRQGMVQSSNLRKRLHEYNMQRHQKQEAAQRPEDDQQVISETSCSLYHCFMRHAK